jgi:hypothetical protein
MDGFEDYYNKEILKRWLDLSDEYLNTLDS